MNIFKANILSFLRKEDGSQSIEFVIVVPLLVWSICSMLAFTESFRVRGVAVDANVVAQYANQVFGQIKGSGTVTAGLVYLWLHRFCPG